MTVKAEITELAEEQEGQSIVQVTENRNMSTPFKSKHKFLDVCSCLCFSLQSGQERRKIYQFRSPEVCFTVWM